MRISERNNGDVAKFHESASARRSETISGKYLDAFTEGESNARGVSTTNASPINSHARDVSASERGPRLFKMLYSEET